ncbi:MAG: coproporphyrinogen III oxidase family protein [Alphaproteobacteria bacterium]|nr:coproporphyrinogen III oxidase family protein [Alphaproteobacteria bacterium]
MSSDATPPPWGIYVHTPWCRVVCPYCAFAVRPVRGADWDAWRDGVLRDWQRLADAFPGRASTVYLGGGTPSLAPPEILRSVLAGLPTAPDAERTLEVDPGTVDRDALAALLDLGIDRLSVGVQTFHERHLRALGRGHDLADTRQLLRHITALAPRTWSLDLMFALPGQTLAELDADLDAVLDHAPPHVSLYGLTFEPGTPLHRLRDRGRVQETDEDLWAAMYDRIGERLGGAGYERYEVSNLARPGHRSRHNEAGWRGACYAGLGPAAHGFLPPTPGAPWGRRSVQPAEVGAWLRAGGASFETPSAHESAVDLLLSTLRHVDGTPLRELARRDALPDPREVARLVDLGLLLDTAERLRLTPAGVRLADGITARLVAAMPPTEP